MVIKTQIILNKINPSQIWLGVFKLTMGLLLLSINPQLSAQNLVKNPSFEETNNWIDFRLHNYVDSFPGVKNWFTPINNRDGEVYNSKWHSQNGYLNLFFPRTDSAHGSVGIGSSFLGSTAGTTPKFFLQTKLDTALELGCPYSVGMYYIFRWTAYTGSPEYDTSWTAANRLGMHLSQQRIRDLGDTNVNGVAQVYAFDNQNIQPQVEIPFTGGFYMDTTQYKLVSDTILADGGEQFLTIGNFYRMDQTFSMSFKNGMVYASTSSTPQNAWNSVAYIDDVFVIPLPPADSLLQTSQDSLICRGDSLTLQASSPNPAYQFLWDNGDTASSRLINQPGKYWVRLLCGCSKTLTDTFYIEEVPALSWNTSLSDTTLCPGETLELALDSSLSYSLNYSPYNSNVLSLTDAGSYYLSWTNGCEEESAAFRLDFHTYAEFPELALDSTTCEDPNIILPLESFVESFEFYLDGDFVANPVRITDHGDYRLSLVQTCDSLDYGFSIDQLGCMPDITIPNAFTPNGDGLNDFFSFEIAGIVNEYDMRIYNRWGELVFQSNEATTFWDGRHKGQAVSGAYTYVLLCTVNDYSQKYSGIVNVLR